MTRRLLVFVLTIFILTPLGAAPPPTREHQVRVENGFTRNLKRLRVDGVEYGALEMEKMTDYIPMRPGGHELFGVLEGGGNIYVDYSFFLRGSRMAKWTLTLNTDRSWTLTEDRPDSRRRKTVKGSLPARSAD